MDSFFAADSAVELFNKGIDRFAIGAAAVVPQNQVNYLICSRVLRRAIRSIGGVLCRAGRSVSLVICLRLRSAAARAQQRKEHCADKK